MDAEDAYILGKPEFMSEDNMMRMSSDSLMDPYPFYPVLDSCSELCLGKGDCSMCGVSRTHGSQSAAHDLLSSSPTQLPLLDWSDVEDQLGEPEQDPMRCININQIFSMPIKPDPDSADVDPMVLASVMVNDCMWSSSSSHRMDMSPQQSSPLPALSVESDMLVETDSVEFGRPDTPQSDESDSHYTDSDDLIQRVPKEKSVRKLPTPVPEKVQVITGSGRSLLKRNQFLKVARAPTRPEPKASVPSVAVAAATRDLHAGDHSYSATTCIGILTPSTSHSESSSEDDGAPSSSRRGQTWQPRRAHHSHHSLDSVALSERLQRPLKGRKQKVKYHSDRCHMPSDDDQPAPERRNNHNNMERMRREMLRDSLNALRRMVPEIAANEKAPKITVLREAAKFCLLLRSKDDALTRQKRKLELDRASLQRKLEAKLNRR